MKKLLSVFLAALLLLTAGCSLNDAERLLSDAAEYSEMLEELDSAFTEDSSEISQSVPEAGSEAAESSEALPAPSISEDGAYVSKDDVALYIHTYGHLPSNFMPKAEARKLGWEGGPLEKFIDSGRIGGDVFGNYEGLLPEADGRVWYECDICEPGASSRGAKRIVFSGDGLIYYTDDHYESFTQLYGG